MFQMRFSSRQALTVKQACAIAVVMEFLGATFLGGEVVKTIRKGIADEECVNQSHHALACLPLPPP